MKIAGFDKLSLLNYPDLVSCTIFTCGCNFCCPYCQNSKLVVNTKETELIDENEVLDYLNQRKKLLDGVCITGGEPTIQKDLYSFIEKIKKLGLKVKLDTNGSNPKVIKELLDNKLIDYIAMDVKTSFDKYNLITNREVDLLDIAESIKLIKESNIDYEFRTTVVKDFVTYQDLVSILNYLGCSNYYLQKFEDRESNIVYHLDSYTDKELKDIYNELKENYSYIKIRGVK